MVPTSSEQAGTVPQLAHTDSHATHDRRRIARNRVGVMLIGLTLTVGGVALNSIGSAPQARAECISVVGAVNKCTIGIGRGVPGFEDAREPLRGIPHPIFRTPTCLDSQHQIEKEIWVPAHYQPGGGPFKGGWVAGSWDCPNPFIP